MKDELNVKEELFEEEITENNEDISLSEEPVNEEIPPENIDVRHCQKIIEAILYAAGYPVSYSKIAKSLEITPGAAKKIVHDYAEIYNNEDGEVPRGVILLMFEGSCQLCTKEQYGTYIREVLGIKHGGNLSQSSIETLAIIAYNEPVTRAFIETVRGVDSTYSISSLAEKKLIETCGRLDVPGRPRLYRTTESFLRVFGLESLADLPEVTVPTDGIQEKIIIPDEE